MMNYILREKNFIAHVSIWLIATIDLTISLTVFKGNLFGIIYLIFFLAFVLTFQSSYSCWANSIKLYCTILALYSACVTVLTYTFQYYIINSFFKTFILEQVLSDIGLVVRDFGWMLFLEPIMPLTLSLLIFLYLNLFHEDFYRYLLQEVKAQQILASRGAELIMATQIEEAKAQALYEKEVMRSIREKLEDLKTDNEETSNAWQRLLSFPHHYQIIRNADKRLFNKLHDDSTNTCRADNWKLKKAFIPDPVGDEMERISEVIGISAVLDRWMKGKPLYNSTSSSNQTPNSNTLPSNSNSAVDMNEVNDQLNSELIETGGDNNGATQEDHKLFSIEDQTFKDETQDVKLSLLRRSWNMLSLILNSCLLSATVVLNRLSRSYRYVSRRMEAEKKNLISEYNLNDERFERDPTWRKWVISTLSETYNKQTNEQNSSPELLMSRIRSAPKIVTTSAAETQDTEVPSDIKKSPSAISSNQGQSYYEAELTDPGEYFLESNIFTQFCQALLYVFLSNTSLLCQIFIVFNQVSTASLLSLPLPLLTFLWGTLSLPRPSKLFWKIVITYTELVIVIKYICQFPHWNWDLDNLNPYYIPNLLGIKNTTILYDLLLLLALFLHQFMLKSLGQWDSSSGDDEKVIVIQKKILDDSANASREENVDLGLGTSANQDLIQSSRLEESADSTIELVPKAINGAEQTQAYNDYLYDSYQNGEVIYNSSNNQVSTISDQVVVRKRSCCYRIYENIYNSIVEFFQHVLNTPHKVQTDVYIWMFLCDFINFLILIYGFGAFGGGYTNQTVASFLDENRIPFSVLIMLLFQFASIIIDRAFYLQKNIGGKLIFQVVLVIGIHVWLFFFLPFTTGHNLTLKEYWPPKAWYVIKCIYFLLSAHQIRSGYPRQVLGNCFTNGYGYFNWGAFKVYRALPLVYDLRLYMDWIWTETTLEFRNWSLMEDMFAGLFIRKCELTLEEEYPTPRAKPIRRISKYLTGGAFILLILAIIWGPLLLFSMGKTVGQSNPPVEMEYELQFVGFQPILRMRATAQQIIILNTFQYDKLKEVYKSTSDQSFLSDYKVGDVVAIKLDGQSNAVWEISPPSKELLMNSIKNNETLTLKSSWTFYRIKKEKSQSFDVNIAGSYQKIIGSSTTQEVDFRNDLFDMLADSSTTKTPLNQTKFVITPPIFPNYLRVPETGQVSLVDQFEESNLLRPLSLAYIRVFDAGMNQTDNSTSWWRADDLCKTSSTNDSYSFWSPDILPHCDSLFVVAFNDRIFTGILALLSAPGIIGLYTTFVVFFARLIRTEPSGKVIYTEIPKVDRVYGLIMDIYMMRECGEFELEEKLFAKLLFLYRSPEMLIDWSKRDDGSQLEIYNQDNGV